MDSGACSFQAARNAGSFVVGVAGGRAKTDRSLELGAHVAVDYLRSDWPRRVREALGDRAATVVLDGVGGAQGRAALELLGFGGRVVHFGWASGEPAPVTADELAARGLAATTLQRPARLWDLEDRALREASAGQLVP